VFFFFCLPLTIRHSPGFVEPVGDDGIERGLDEFLNQGIRGVVRAGGFAGIAGAGGGIGDAREAEDAAWQVEGGNEF
jgi:hypothetical protein